MHATFNVNLQPKRINGADITGKQLGRYVEAYARLFQERAVLPEARMLLDAVADANSRNALDDAMARYSSAMEASFTAAAYAKDEEVERQHEAAAAEALELFDLVSARLRGREAARPDLLFVPACSSCLLFTLACGGVSRKRRNLLRCKAAQLLICVDWPRITCCACPLLAGRASRFLQAANFGTSTGIARYRSQLEESLAAQRVRYIARNAERNPLRNAELYVFALAVAVGAYVLRLLIDWTCAPWADVCRRGSQLFGFIYTIIFLGAIVTMYFTGRRSWERVSTIVNALLAVGGAAAGGSGGGASGAGAALGSMFANVTSAAASAVAAAGGSGAASRSSPSAASSGATGVPASSSAAGTSAPTTSVAGLRRRRSNGEA